VPLVLFAIITISYFLTVKNFYHTQTMDSSFLHNFPTLWPREYRTTWQIHSKKYTGNSPVAYDDINSAPLAHRKGMARWWKFVKDLPQIEATRGLNTVKHEYLLSHTPTISETHIMARLADPATIRLRKLYYLHWVLKDKEGNEIHVFPDPETGLILFDLPQGNHELILGKKMLPVEKTGVLLSGLVLLLILAKFYQLKEHKENHKIVPPQDPLGGEDSLQGFS